MSILSCCEGPDHPKFFGVAMDETDPKLIADYDNADDLINVRVLRQEYKIVADLSFSLKSTVGSLLHDNKLGISRLVDGGIKLSPGGRVVIARHVHLNMNRSFGSDNADDVQEMIVSGAKGAHTMSVSMDLVSQKTDHSL